MVGLVLAIGVVLVAWLDDASLGMFLVGLILVALGALYVMRHFQTSANPCLASPADTARILAAQIGGGRYSQGCRQEQEQRTPGCGRPEILDEVDDEAVQPASWRPRRSRRR